MALFGGSKSSTSTSTKQIGLEGGGIIASGGGTVVQEFPEAVAGFASEALELAGQSIAQSGAITAAASQSFAAIAEREKTPLTEYLPFAAVMAAAVVMVALNWK